MTKDLLHSIRSLLRHPGFTAVAVITLMLAIGVNTTIFSVVNAVLLKALPFRDPAQLVSVHKTSAQSEFPGIAGYQYLAWKDQSTNFEDLAAFGEDNINLTGNFEPERIPYAQVTASLFSTLGVQPVRGRFFLPEEDKPGATNVVVVSEKFWQLRYGRDEKILEQTLTLDNKPYLIVGVMPNSFRFPGEFDIWLPFALDPYKEVHGGFFALVEVVGRLKPNTTLAGAQTELGLIARQASAEASQPGKEPLPVAPVEVVPLQPALPAMSLY